MRKLGMSCRCGHDTVLHGPYCLECLCNQFEPSTDSERAEKHGEEE